MLDQDVPAKPAAPRPMPGNAQVIEFRSSTRAWLLQSAAGWVFMLAVVAAFALGAAFGYALETLAGIAVLLLLVFGWQYFSYRFALYWLDGDRLFMRRGLLMRSEEEIELYRIKEVRVTFSVVQQMFDNGTLHITSSDLSGMPAATPDDQGRSTLVIPHVLDARLIRGEIRDRVEAIRERRGVRELDIS